MIDPLKKKDFCNLTKAKGAAIWIETSVLFEKFLISLNLHFLINIFQKGLEKIGKSKNHLLFLYFNIKKVNNVVYFFCKIKNQEFPVFIHLKKNIILTIYKSMKIWWNIFNKIMEKR